MSILDIDVEADIMDFSKPNRNGRVYDPDSIKVPDNYIPPDSVKNSDDYTRPIEVVEVSDKLPEVGNPNCIYVLKGNLYTCITGEWREISSMVRETKKMVEEMVKEIMDEEYNNENNL